MVQQMLRFTVSGTGWVGSPSINQYYFNTVETADPEAVVPAAWDRVRAAWEQLKTLCPNYVTHTLSQDVELIDTASGEIETSYVNSGTDPVIEGVGTGLSLPPATAACLNLNTGVFKAGRKVRGRSFVSPISQGSSDADGTPTAACIAIVAAVSGILSFDDAYIAQYCVWSRPVGGVGGTAPLVQSISMPDRFAVLRSRRD